MADAIENISMVTININPDQDMATFSSDTWKMTLYDLNLVEWGKGIGISPEFFCLSVSYPANPYLF